MKIKFNHFERVAGLFVLTAIVGSLLTAVSAAIKQGWFEKKVQYQSTFENADGIHPGTMVQMAGLKAGTVEDVELQGDNKIKVSFHVLGKFQNRVRQDSTVQLIRPFVIGDRVLEINVGTEKAEVLPEHATIDSIETMDLMTLVSGKKLGSTLGKISDLLVNLQNLAESFLSRERTESMVRIFDRLDPLMGNLNTMSLEVTKLSKQATAEDNLKNLMHHTALLTRELNIMVPEINKQNPDMAKQVAMLVNNLAVMTDNMKVVTDVFKDMGPEMPMVARRAVEALNEATVLMKALQKSFMLRGNVKEVMEEEEKAKPRQPAEQHSK